MKKIGKKAIPAAGGNGTGTKPRRSRRSGAGKRQKKIWTSEEDEILLRLIEKFGPAKWSAIASFIQGRQGKQCRERWHNHLNPNILKSSWGDDEEWKLFLLHKLYGNKWAILAQMINGRTDNTIKNHWNSIMRRKTKQFEARLAEAIADLSNESSEGKFESLLLERIAKGEFDNNNCKKGRKRNYNNFFEKNLLEEFVVRRPGVSGPESLLFEESEEGSRPQARTFVLEQTPKPHARKDTPEYLQETQTNHRSSEPVQEFSAHSIPRVQVTDEKFNIASLFRLSPEGPDEANFLEYSLSKYFKKCDENLCTPRKLSNFEGSNFKLTNQKSPDDATNSRVLTIPMNWD